ncbi:MAG: hypothetical protein ACXVHX_02280 [Solirubrobacteraceae bacterium]
MTRGAARVKDPGGSEWVTQDQAAVLTGAPLSSINWWARTGKLQTRPLIEGPTVNRQSAISYAAKRQQHKAAATAKRTAREAEKSQRPRRPRNTITTQEAGAILERVPRHVPTIARREGLTLTPWRGRLLLVRDEVEALAREMATADQKWASIGEIAKAAHVSTRSVYDAIRAGVITTKPDARPCTPRLDRDSAMRWADGVKARREEAAARRAQPPRRTGPPNDGRSWMSVRSAAVLLGISEYRTVRQIEREELPATRHNGKWWLQPVHVFSVLAGRDHRSKSKAG